MKPAAYLINTSRGPIVDERALVAALEGHKIAGAALDVYDQEPLPAGHPLLRLENVVLTLTSATSLLKTIAYFTATPSRMSEPSSPAIRSVSLSLRDHATSRDRLARARVRALRSVAIELASRSPRCFGGRVARRRLGSCRNRAPVLHSTKLRTLLDENTLAMSRNPHPLRETQTMRHPRDHSA